MELRLGAIAVFAFALAAEPAASPTAPAHSAFRSGAIPSATGTPRALPNDNRVAAGRLADGVLTLRLEARAASWHPEDTTGPGIPVFAFAEEGEPARIPGPMIRVPAGTEVRVTLRSALPVPMRLRGLQERTAAPDSMLIGPGETRELRFRADVPGTYFYWGRTDDRPAVPLPGARRDATLLGVFIVDSAGTAPRSDERVLVLGSWADTASVLGTKSGDADRVMRREGFPREVWAVFTVNGLSWPHTERVSYTAGDTVRWRVINGSAFPHPMHLHGFYFDVDARGDAQRDTLYAPAQRRMVVTELMTAGTTMTMSWVPTRPGNWLFHCHLIQHVSEALRLSPAAGAAHAGHLNHAEHGMAGLVLGIHVAPSRGMPPEPDAPPRRKLRVFVTERANVFDGYPAHSYVLQEGPAPPAHDSILHLSSTLVLRQHEPTEITVLNVSRQTTAVHWHGLELESFYDGVGDWSGWGARLAPMIAPGDSFVVRLTPPRSGTFIYHTHASEGIQLASGLYGPLIVLPEHASRDTTDRVLLFSIGGPHDDGRPLINGTVAPPPIELRAGVAHRIRLINIAPMETGIIELLRGDSIQRWRALAKDGAELPASQATPRDGRVGIRPGETYDFEILRQRPESLTLRLITIETIANRVAARARGLSAAQFPRVVISIPVIVRD